MAVPEPECDSVTRGRSPAAIRWAAGRGSMVDEQAMPCPLCSGPLESSRAPQGTVWICRSCAAGATTLGVIRKVAPRAFINHLWQAARSHGQESSCACPSCTQPLLEFDARDVAVEPTLKVCCRCFLVWLDCGALAALRLRPRARSATREAAARLQADALAQPKAVADEARSTVLLAIAAAQEVATVIDSALGEPAA